MPGNRRRKRGRALRPPSRMPNNAYGEINAGQLATSAGEQVKQPKAAAFSVPVPSMRKRY